MARLDRSDSLFGRAAESSASWIRGRNDESQARFCLTSPYLAAEILDITSTNSAEPCRTPASACALPRLASRLVIGGGRCRIIVSSVVRGRRIRRFLLFYAVGLPAGHV